jgi:hypothetical protein
MVEATEDMAEVMAGDSVMATGIAFLEDLDTAGGVILTGGTTLTRGITLTIPTIILTRTIIPITILIIMEAMGNRWRLHRRSSLRKNRGDSNVLFGTFVRTRRVTTLMSKIALRVG